ncbi:TraG family conjugative transposon ATPase [Pedobacter jeongneungensis]|uniref:TraG family conjugative transposon ATPase n=1 Tax=Pedobacter jeongneungensis TaxID=947309 RepID=UPI00046AE827|nr:TraG family conjugative transposon ATPase [Pedobacter jeongneungensis]
MKGRFEYSLAGGGVKMKGIFPIYKVEKDCLLSVNGDVTVAFKLTLPEIFTLSSNDYEAMHQAFIRAIRLLPEHSIFHKQDWFLREKFSASSAAGDFLEVASNAHFFGRQRLSQESFVFITCRGHCRKLSSSAASNLLRKRIVPKSVLLDKGFSAFFDGVAQFVRVLEDSGYFKLERLDEDALCGTANRPGLLERYCFLIGEDSPSVLRDVHLKGGISVGEKKVELFSLSDAEDLPGNCGPRINYEPYCTDRSKFSVGFASPLGLLLDTEHIYNQYIFIGDERKTLKNLEAKRRRLNSLSAYSRENAAARDAVNDFLNEAVVMQRLAVRAHFNVLCWSMDESSGQSSGTRVASAMAGLDAVCKLERDGAPQIWYAGIPGNAADFPMNDSFDTFLEQGCCFLNLEGNYQSSDSAFGFRLGDRLSGFPVHVDLSDEPMRLGLITNRNKFILGPSGSGKSFFTNHLMRSCFAGDAHVVIVDIGHSYRGLCEQAGGYYFTYSEDSPICFNPFFIAAGEVLDTEKKESIKTLLLALWKREGETYRQSEYVAVSNALNLYYAYLSDHPSVFACFDSFYEFLMDDFLEVLKDGRVAERNFDIDNFLFVLNPYYKNGEFGYLLNARENLDLLNQPFIVFEIDSIKSHPILFPIVTLIIMEMYVAKMRKLKGVRKIILIEESWKAIAKEGMAEYIKFLFKTVRKFFGEAIVVTQEVEDIISSPIVKQAIINNSDCKILLDQSKFQNKFDDIQALLGLSEKEKAQVLSMNRANDPSFRYKEVFVSLGGQKSMVYRTEVSLEEYLCFTTEETERLQVDAYSEKLGSLEAGIKALAAEMRVKSR